MRLDHVAYRVADRNATAEFFIEAFGYKIQTEFEIYFNEEKTIKAQCIALEPPEKSPKLEDEDIPFTFFDEYFSGRWFHMAPEIFVSDGTENSVVKEWVEARNGIGGIHHMAYQVESVEETMKLWIEKGWAEFTTNKPLTCPGLTQVFSKPHPLTGIIYEFIEREGQGFCKDNVKDLMESTKDLK